MSSFYDDASLVVIPSGYKTSKIYAEKPTDGSGDLTFTRASGATRVGANGLIEEVRTNYALQSQTFATASAWATTNGTLTNNAGTAPDGTNTASKLVATNTDPYVYQSITLTGPVVASCYFKGVGSSIGKTSELRIGAAVTTFTLTANWQRISVTSTVAGAANYGVEAPNLSVVVGDEVLLWGFQVEQGDIATAYIPTTTAAVSVGPVSNLPRLDYTNSSCPRLLLEPQRTNQALFSEQFNNAAWTKSGSSVTSNSIVAPDGTTTADTLNVTATAYSSIYNTAIFSLPSGLYTQSVYAKKGTKNFLYILDFAASGAKAWYNLNTGAVGTVAAGFTATMQDAGNGWYRCTFTPTSAVTPLYFHFGASDTDNSFTPSSSGTIYIWGAQVEAGAYATSYIPTLAASVTRVADGNLDFSALVNNTSFTFFLEASFTFADGNFFDARVLTAGGNYLGFYNGFVAIYNVGSGTTVFGSSLAANTNHKVLFKYDGANAKFYRNGTLLLSVAATSVGTFIDGLIYNADQEGLKIKQFLYFPTALTDAQCVELTTL